MIGGGKFERTGTGLTYSQEPTVIKREPVDLAQILVEGTKTVYGEEKAGQLQAEFEKLEKPNYRSNAENLTAVVDRICGDAGYSESVDMSARDDFDFAASLLEVEDQVC